MIVKIRKNYFSIHKAAFFLFPKIYLHNSLFAGLWEIPLVMWNDLGNGRCSMLDACSNPNNPEDVFKLLWTNFARHYNTNRAPIGKEDKEKLFSNQQVTVAQSLF